METSPVEGFLSFDETVSLDIWPMLTSGSHIPAPTHTHTANVFILAPFAVDVSHQLALRYKNSGSWSGATDNMQRQTYSFVITRSESFNASGKMVAEQN